MKITINIDNEVSNIEVFDGTDYLRITNVGEESTLQTSIKKEDIEGSVYKMTSEVMNAFLKPLIKDAVKEYQMKTSPRSLMLDKATGDELKMLSELLNVTKGLKD